PAPAPVEGPTCPGCGAPVNEGDAFCMSCGAKL
ncbi:zinc-ribbon domain-containing protein, partial [Enorma massiliensis]